MINNVRMSGIMINPNNQLPAFKGILDENFRVSQLLMTKKEAEKDQARMAQGRQIASDLGLNPEGISKRKLVKGAKYYEDETQRKGVRRKAVGVLKDAAEDFDLITTWGDQRTENKKTAFNAKKSSKLQQGLIKKFTGR